MHRLLYLLVFAVLLGEALLLSPPQRPDTNAWVLRLITGDWAGEEPSVVALFQLMGVWPFAMAALLAPRLRRRPVPLWPFALGSMALGAFVLLPGLALGGEPAPEARWQGWLRHRALLSVLGLATAALMGWAVVAGDPAALSAAWRGEGFVHVMSHDFVALWIASLIAAHEQGERRWWWCGVPLLGPVAARFVAEAPPTAPAA